jgi:DNA-binding beta-propeller fold protein YncE
LKLDSGGSVLQTVTVGSHPAIPLFDGANIWVPNQSSNSVCVVRASTGLVLATLTGNGLSTPTATAFDGQRVLVTNQGGSNSVSLWKAADLTTIGSFSTGSGSIPAGAASDGVNFWVSLGGLGKLARF